MGLLDNIFPGRKKSVKGPSYKTFSEYAPIDTNWNGDAYELELTRACIERFAQACLKLNPEYRGTAKHNLQTIFRTAPNTHMTWPTFLARVATILEIENSALIVPEYDRDLVTVRGLWPVLYSSAEVLEYNHEPWIHYWTMTGEEMALRLKEVCLITKFQYTSDIFGDDVNLKSTMNLIKAQEEAQKAAIKNGAKIRFIGKVEGMMKEDTLEAKRQMFVDSNLSAQNNSGLMLYDQSFSEIRELEHHGYTIEPDEMERIENDVFNYYGTPKHILQNSYDENQWAAWYEGKVEPFAIKLGEGLNQMLLTPRERLNNNISFSSNRLQYASMASKRNMIRDMVDRGLFTMNQALDILQMAHIDGGDARIIRGEYIDITDPADRPKRVHDDEGRDSDKEKNFYDDLSTDTEDDQNSNV